MFSIFQDREQLEDDLYREEEDDTEGSEVDSELEFHLYSQLHYSSNPGEISQLEDEEKKDPECIQDYEKVTKDDADKLGQLSGSRPPSHKTDKLQGDKEENVRKSVEKKIKPKCPRPTSSVFEEVIVIDSGPDVITLSEDDSEDDEEGVCALKGQRSQQLLTSTPAQQAKKMLIGKAVNVISSEVSESESESESELSSSSSSSDSDDLENWMILGRDHQDGDQSISLNLDGVAESGTDVEEHFGSWVVSDKDRRAQIFNKDKGVRAVVQRVANRYYTDKNVQCKNCNKMGHLSKNCPEPTKVSPCFLCGTIGHKVNECPYRHCNNCGLPGHMYISCSERSYWHKQCHRCGMTGHFFDACPEIWRQYHVTIKIGLPVTRQGKDKGRTPAYCYNCAKKGHFGHECTRQRMFNGTYPSTPFINHYDSIEDIKCRQHRMKLKGKNLKNNGIFRVPPSPSTPEPPKKKQKISQEKSNHRHNRRPSFKTDLPSSSHIFFSDTSDAIPKTNKQSKHKPVSLEKPWKPKRPVPQSRDSLPKAKVVVDEADDFPRGGGQGEEAERKKKRKKMKKNGRPLCWTETGEQGLASEQSSKEKRKDNAKRNANKKLKSQMYPSDENLFIIKQRKRKR